MEEYSKFLHQPGIGVIPSKPRSMLQAYWEGSWVSDGTKRAEKREVNKKPGGVEVE